MTTPGNTRSPAGAPSANQGAAPHARAGDHTRALQAMADALAYELVRRHVDAENLYYAERSVLWQLGAERTGSAAAMVRHAFDRAWARVETDWRDLRSIDQATDVDLHDPTESATATQPGDDPAR